LFHPKNTEIVRPPMPSAHFDTNIYATVIHYCRFDRNMPVPEEFRKICSERPDGYNSSWSLEEKIKFLRENGKRFTLDQLHQLMDIVYNKNRLQTPTQNQYSKVEAMREILEFLDEKRSTVIDNKLISHLLNVIYDYKPLQYVKEDSEHTEKLKNYLAISNKRMYETIYEFIDKYGNLNARHLEHIDDFIMNITSWTIDKPNGKHDLTQDNMYNVVQFITNSIFSMSKIFPEVILNKKNIESVPKHWNLSPNHQHDIIRFIKKYYDPLNKFKDDKVLSKLLKEIQTQLIDLNILIQHIPIYTPIHRGENTFYSLFDKKTIYMLLQYLWYSVIYEFIIMTDDVDLLNLDIIESKNRRREEIREQRDYVETLQTISEVNEEEMVGLSEISINIGNVQDLKTKTAQLLTAFLDIDLENKKSVDLDYSRISEKMDRSKQAEKKLITDFFRDMDSEERKVKNLEKTYKMGRWNIGMQKGLVEYDKNTYDRERGEIIERLNGTVEYDDDVAIMERDIYQLEEDTTAEVEEEYEREANDISGLGEDYMDGEYYDEDRGNDEGFD
jgi:hypothetical protein